MNIHIVFVWNRYIVSVTPWCFGSSFSFVRCLLRVNPVCRYHNNPEGATALLMSKIGIVILLCPTSIHRNRRSQSKSFLHTKNFLKRGDRSNTSVAITVTYSCCCMRACVVHGSHDPQRAYKLACGMHVRIQHSSSCTTPPAFSREYQVFVIGNLQSNC